MKDMKKVLGSHPDFQNENKNGVVFSGEMG